MHFDEARSAVAAGRPVNDVAREFVAALSDDERLWCLDGDAPTWAGLHFLSDDGYHKAPFAAAQIDRVGLPGVHFSDGPRGAVVGNATAFPVSMARGAAWDPELEFRIGDAIGKELRAVGATLTGAVCINLLRHPAWGRAQETYGEDPHHVGEMGAAFTRGLQRHVMACVKHFACNSMENARFTVDVQVDEVALHEVFLPHFKRVVDEGVASVMSAYNRVNGDWCGESHHLLTEILREEWGFEGFVISDWILGLRDAAASVRAGLDIEMPYRMLRQRHLPAALEDGGSLWADVNRSAERVVATLLRFDQVLQRPADPSTLCSPEHRALAREAAARSVVLLRNEPVDGSPLLPIAAGAQVAVMGRLGDTVNLGDGGSSDVWDLDCHTVLDGLRAAGLATTYDDGADPSAAAECAAAADIAVVVVGYTYLDEGEYIGATDPSVTATWPTSDEPEVVARFEATLADLPPWERPPRMADRPRMFATGGDRTSLRLLPHDVEVIRAVAAANPRTVVVIQSGSAVISSEWVSAVPAVVQAWYGGSQAGPGLADVLLGHVNPSARLPFSVPVEESHLPPFQIDATDFRYDRWHGWWHLRNEGTAAAFPFGFGLSYTTFELDRASLHHSDVDATIVVEGTARNSGAVDGADVVQVYADLPFEGAPRRLVGFARVEVPAGEPRTFTVEIPEQRLYGRDPERHEWVPPVGDVTFVVARHAEDPAAIALTAHFPDPGPTR